MSLPTTAAGLTMDRYQNESIFPFTWRQPVLLILIYSLAFFFLATALHTQYGFPLDDSYIHQTVARNLAHYGIPGFIPGERSSGATSLIWTYIQAANYSFLHVNPVAYNLAFSWLLFAAIGPLLFTLARKDGLAERSCWILAATPALCGNFLWLGLIGMEHLLFVTFSLLAIYFWFDPTPRRSWTSAILSGFAVGLLAITRPEAMVFGPMLLVVSALITPAKVRRSFLQMEAVFAIWVAFLSLILAANYYTSHAWMPATLKGRTWLYFHTSGGPHSVASILRFLGAWVQRLPRMFSTHFTDQMSSLTQVHGAFAVFGFALAALALLGLIVLAGSKPRRVGFLMLWALVHFSIYLLTFPTAGHGGRYQPLTLLLVFPGLAFGTLWLLGRVASIFKAGQAPSGNEQRANGLVRWPVMVTAMVMLIAGAASLRTWRMISIDGIGHINSTHGMIGEWLKANVPPDATIAAFDIGRISYDWGRGITDLGGLVDPTYYHYLVDGRVPDYLQAKHIQYLILPGVGTESFGFQNTNLTMTKVAEYCSPRDPWLIGWRYTIHATQCQELYKLSYPTAITDVAGTSAAVSGAAKSQ